MPTPTAERAPASDAWGQTPRPSPSLPMTAGMPPPSVEKGSLLIIRQFDIADEINLEKARSLQLSERHVLTRPRATALLLSNPPLTISLGQRTLELGGKPIEVEVQARAFDFGAISVRFRLPLARGLSWADLTNVTRLAQAEESLTRVAREVATDIGQRLSQAITGRHDNPLYEDYAIVFVEQFAGISTPQALPLDAIARLLLGEPETAALSSGEVDEATRRRSSYFGDDLCVTGWNMALVVEPTGDTDPIDVLELANAQLLELRIYDAVLDRELGRLYDEVGRRRGRTINLTRNYGPVLRRAMVLLLEIAEFIERVENSLKIIGDVYLARLYASAVETLRIPSWEQAVTRKQALVQQVYDVLKSEVDTRRGQIMEIIVILLILGELVQALHIAF
jgi:hypothetical protein